MIEYLEYFVLKETVFNLDFRLPLGPVLSSNSDLFRPNF